MRFCISFKVFTISYRLYIGIGALGGNKKVKGTDIIVFLKILLNITDNVKETEEGKNNRIQSAIYVDFLRLQAPGQDL